MRIAIQSTGVTARPGGHGPRNRGGACGHGGSTAGPGADDAGQGFQLAELAEVGRTKARRKAGRRKGYTWLWQPTRRSLTNSIASIRTDFLVRTPVHVELDTHFPCCVSSLRVTYERFAENI